VFGICEEGTRRTRLFYVENRREDTLLPIILSNVETESTIYSDGWRGYYNLGTYFSVHHTVNHTEYFVDPDTGANTQKMECLRIENSISCAMKKALLVICYSLISISGLFHMKMKIAGFPSVFEDI